VVKREILRKEMEEERKEREVRAKV